MVQQAERRRERIEFLTSVAQELLVSGVLPADRMTLRRKRIELVVDSYFILSDAFKRWRIKNAHLTEDPKIAALQCMAIMALEPFRLHSPSNAQTIGEAKCNEMFALAAATNVLGFPVDLDRPGEGDFWRRMLDILTELRSETLQPFLVDRSMNIDRDPSTYYGALLHDADKLAINNLICICELLGGKINTRPSIIDRVKTYFRALLSR